jgi:hypothetical protein
LVERNLCPSRAKHHASRHYISRAFATDASQVLGLPIYDINAARSCSDAPRNAHGVRETVFGGSIFDVEIIASYISVMKPDEALRGICEFPFESWADVKASKQGPRDLRGQVMTW